MSLINVNVATLELAARDLAFKQGRRFAAALHTAKAKWARLRGDRDEFVRSAMAASRYSDGSACREMLRDNLDDVKQSVMRMLPSPISALSLDQRTVVISDPVIKNGRVVRKGVLLVSFTETCGLLLASVDRSKLARLFHLVLEPSWAGYADPGILGWLNYPEPVIVQASEKRDRELLSSLSSNLVPVGYGAGDWILPSDWPESLYRDTRFDSLCVANYGWWKRVHAFVRATAEANAINRGHKAALVLGRLGKSLATEKRLRSVIKAYGAESLITVFEALQRDELNEIYFSSRVLVFPSLKEGSSRVIYEAMCRDVPVIILSNNVGVNKEHINSHTGWIVPETHLGRELANASRARASQLQPREWFLSHLGPERTTEKLKCDLHRLFPHEDWANVPLRVKANTPEARLLEPHSESLPLSAWLAYDL
jgi:glycosyltransferase involved in cell wall biosynthesis